MLLQSQVGSSGEISRWEFPALVLAWPHCRQILPGGWLRWLKWWSPAQVGRCRNRDTPPTSPGIQIVAWPKRLFNHPVFSGRKWLQRQNTMKKSNSQHGKSLENTPASQNPGLVGGVECPQSSASTATAAMVPRDSLVSVPCLAACCQPFPWLISSPGYSRQQPPCAANLAGVYPPQVHKTTLNLQQKLLPETQCTKASFPLAAETLSVS